MNDAVPEPAPEPNTTATDVLIAGAGPTGLMLAAWLRRFGVRVLVADGKDGPTRESRAVIVQARSLEIYDQLGLGPAVQREGRRVENLSFWQERVRFGRLPVGALGRGLTPHPYIVSLEQSLNETLLYGFLRDSGGEVWWGATLEGFDEDDAGVTARLRREDGTPLTVRARYLCGADGARSTVRELLGLPFAGTSNPLQFYVADVTATGALDDGAVNVKLSGAGFLLAFPMRGPGHFRLIGLLSPAQVRGDLPDYDDAGPLVRDTFGVAVREVRWFSSYRVHHRVAEHFRRGRAFLLGDAAHVHSPVGGQGMNTGLGDAHNLAWKLAGVLNGEADDRLLDSYEAERRPFAQALVRTVDRTFRLATRDALLNRFLRGRVVPGVMGRVLRRTAAETLTTGTPTLVPPGRAPWFPRRLFGVVSQLGVRYPASPLSRGRAGRVRGGDRLPYVPFGEGSN